MVRRIQAGHKFFKGPDPKSWFKNSGAKSLVEQAQRQLRAVRATNTPIRWHVAEEAAANAIRKLLDRYEDTASIEVVFTPPVM
ncbi:restriction endonuclease fold toxin 5 domain-containing protein [Myxococcus sp. K15C18031901]|uniref:Tox-REase-5 domain-containing protein n=1 Tax=Myxococcus dinghuensis TaxID=2906761 RepID=UPI0020A749B1|nr:Tox-REase-5 domain-containing protein [Myxococcus dinghuensis]MCP3105382.1 restriction endonuclease fold toxin 5 domain-containing protein [Myxococcus dinghuensis]